jgi:hypothetical protein
MVFIDVFADEMVWMRHKLTTPAVLAGRLPGSVMCKGMHGHQISHRLYYPHWFALNGTDIKIVVFYDVKGLEDRDATVLEESQYSG